MVGESVKLPMSSFNLALSGMVDRVYGFNKQTNQIVAFDGLNQCLLVSIDQPTNNTEVSRECEIDDNQIERPVYTTPAILLEKGNYETQIEEVKWRGWFELYA